MALYNNPKGVEDDRRFPPEQAFLPSRPIHRGTLSSMIVLEAKDRHKRRHVNKEFHNKAKINFLNITNHCNAPLAHLWLHNLTELEFALAKVVQQTDIRNTYQDQWHESEVKTEEYLE